ncbi:MAG: type II 3-dehydroquinate dehydratase [Clostridia bacterium]|nr:type II 3-dehydroquinate dehydratase [Clostridia bacterium]
MKLFIINGPNLNMLGIREKGIYGNQDYDSLIGYIRDVCDDNNIEAEFFQSNHEGELVDIIQSAYKNADGIVINPAAYTHTSIAILDAVKAVMLPTVEVHISNIYEREEFRRVSYVSLACVKSIYGHGFEGYKEAVLFLKEYIEKAEKR